MDSHFRLINQSKDHSKDLRENLKEIPRCLQNTMKNRLEEENLERGQFNRGLILLLLILISQFLIRNNKYV